MTTEHLLHGIGDVANNLMVPVVLASGFLASASFIVGMSFLFSSVIRFVQYRTNPLANPLSKVFFMFFSGIFLLFLPLIYHLTDNGIPTTIYGNDSSQHQEKSKAG
ncbi:MAG: hypothetical protein SFW66_03745 [Gammaproteobacteria bacterium]|nr:hypothetical protein [Gammaproteobacteria bacterium]